MVSEPKMLPRKNNLFQCVLKQIGSPGWVNSSTGIIDFVVKKHKTECCSEPWPMPVWV